MKIHKWPSRTCRVLISVAFVIVLAGCAGYVPGRQAYWDEQVKEMCARDGGVRIFEKLHIKRSNVRYLGKIDGRIGISIKRLAHPDAPAYSELQVTYLHDANPQVTRNESTIIRRIDGTVVARWVVYARFGGDFPSPSHGSSFSCPDLYEITEDLQRLFVIEET